ncbi:hypothetical protein Hypma_005076 [Hypsizygus marmoreus]|uniref:Uncharacterized protein n=1 Tax=Hypsizygus marmoreus TaxID=39966 RepID=A0A369K0L1_HYPMA|nr:hypothetical protein Hypma_005076 [Hypsizygus marmoreus]
MSPFCSNTNLSHLECAPLVLRAKIEPSKFIGGCITRSVCFGQFKSLFARDQGLQSFTWSATRSRHSKTLYTVHRKMCTHGKPLLHSYGGLWPAAQSKIRGFAEKRLSFPLNAAHPAHRSPNHPFGEEHVLVNEQKEYRIYGFRRNPFRHDCDFVSQHSFNLDENSDLEINCESILDKCIFPPIDYGLTSQFANRDVVHNDSIFNDRGRGRQVRCLLIPFPERHRPPVYQGTSREFLFQANCGSGAIDPMDDSGLLDEPFWRENLTSRRGFVL